MQYPTLFRMQRTVSTLPKKVLAPSELTVIGSFRGVYILKSKYTRILKESVPTLGTTFLWTFLHNGAHIDFCFELEGRVWIGSANILILHSQDGEILGEEENTNKHHVISFMRKEGGEKKLQKSFSFKKKKKKQMMYVFPQRKRLLHLRICTVWSKVE